jgi:hypothetical protein
MIRRFLLAALLAIAPSLFTGHALSAQNPGFVHLRTHLASENPLTDHGVLHTYVQAGNGVQESFTEQFAPGSYTLARVDAQIQGCIASSGSVSFTITAGQWTTVDVPVSFQSCYYENIVDWNATWGFGSVTTFGGSVSTNGFASCAIVPDNASVLWQDWHSCHANVPYGAQVSIAVAADANSCCSFNSQFVMDTSLDHQIMGQTFTLNGTDPEAPVTTNPVLSVHEVGSNDGGQVLSTTFRLVNHGPGVARGIDLIVSPSSDGDAYKISATSTDGRCDDVARCHFTLIPPGDSTTIVGRYEAVPRRGNDSTANGDLPFIAPACLTVSLDLDDPPTACLPHTVPITVALGGSTPASRTVSEGATDVPMIEFLFTPTSTQTVNSVTISAHGTGNEQVDVTAVKLYVDQNGNGQIDAGDSAIATGTFAANDGTVTLSVNPAYSISAPTNLLVTYSFSLTLAQRLGGGLSLAMLPLLFLPAIWRRKRVIVMLAMAMITTVALTACGSDSTTGPPAGGASATFQSTLTGANVSGTDVTGLSLAGATITVTK